MIDIVGLDLSLTSTGYAHGTTVAISSKFTGPQRLDDIATQVLTRLADLALPVVIVENYSYGSRNSQAHAIGELGGVVRVELWRRGIPYVEVPPTNRAMFATGKGNAGKGEVMSTVSARTGIAWTGKGGDDRCDAWLLEEMGLAKLGMARFTWPAKNLTALDKVDWSPLVKVATP